MKNLIYNAIRTPDGTVLESYDVHDFRGRKQADGKEYAVDGGLHYARRLFSDDDFKELSLYDDEPHVVQREVIKWGTYGKCGNQPFSRVAVEDMTTGHIVAVLSDCRPSYVHEVCMWRELEARLTLISEHFFRHIEPEVMDNMVEVIHMISRKIERLIDERSNNSG